MTENLRILGFETPCLQLESKSQASEMRTLLSADPGAVPGAFRCHFLGSSLTFTAETLLGAPGPEARGGILVMSYVLCDSLSLYLWNGDTKAQTEGGSQLQDKILFPFATRLTHLLGCFYVNLMTLLLKAHLDVICDALGSLLYKVHTHTSIPPKKQGQLRLESRRRMRKKEAALKSLQQQEIRQVKCIVCAP